MLYPILHRLEKQSYAESFWQKTDAGRKRKYYRITESGQLYLKELNAQWDLIIKTLKEAGDE